MFFRRRGYSEEEELSLLRMVQLLIQGICLHVVKGDEVDYEKFRSDLLALAGSLDERPSLPEVLAVIRSVLKGLETYSLQTTKFVLAKSVTLSTLVTILVEKLTAASAAGEHGTVQLQSIARQLERASAIEDLHHLKGRLLEALESLDEERTGQRCGTRLAAEEALSAAHRRGAPIFAATFVVEGLQGTNARYGYAAGDELLRVFSRHLIQGLPASDQMFRWSGPAFVALLERDAAVADVQKELQNLMAGKLEKQLRVAGRMVALAVNATWEVFAISGHGSLEGVMAKIDQSITAQMSAYSRAHLAAVR
jgi:GGDEF domain-containing protein